MKKLAYDRGLLDATRMPLEVGRMRVRFGKM